MYLLDTNICIYALKASYPALNQKLLSVPPDEICISSITLGELEYGAAKSNWSAQNRQRIYMFLANYRILPFTQMDAVIFGRLRAELALSGTPIGAYDMMIAAQGVAGGFIVVTHNTKEFTRVPGIKLQDWV